MYDYVFIRSVEALELDVEDVFTQAFPYVSVNRAHYPLHSTLVLEVKSPEFSSEVEVDISISSPVNHKRFVDHVIEGFWEIVNERASCAFFLRLPDGERHFFDEKGERSHSEKAPEVEIEDLWDSLPDIF